MCSLQDIHEFLDLSPQLPTLEDGTSPRAVVYAGLLTLSTSILHQSMVNSRIFFSKFVQTLNKQLEDYASPRAIVYAGLLRFSKTVFANFHLAPINGEFMIFFFEICPNPQ